jgi:DNA-directed RNA polymerase specialized sigma24 family protein
MDRSGEPDDIASRTSALRRGQGRADAALSVSELFRAHHLELVRLAVVMVGDLATAEDVVRDCFERLHQARAHPCRDSRQRWSPG